MKEFLEKLDNIVRERSDKYRILRNFLDRIEGLEESVKIFYTEQTLTEFKIATPRCDYNNISFGISKEDSSKYFLKYRYYIPLISDGEVELYQLTLDELIAQVKEAQNKMPKPLVKFKE